MVALAADVAAPTHRPPLARWRSSRSTPRRPGSASSSRCSSSSPARALGGRRARGDPVQRGGHPLLGRMGLRLRPVSAGAACSSSSTSPGSPSSTLPSAEIHSLPSLYVLYTVVGVSSPRRSERLEPPHPGEVHGGLNGPNAYASFQEMSMIGSVVGLSSATSGSRRRPLLSAPLGPRRPSPRSSRGRDLVRGPGVPRRSVTRARSRAIPRASFSRIRLSASLHIAIPFFPVRPHLSARGGPAVPCLGPGGAPPRAAARSSPRRSCSASRRICSTSPTRPISLARHRRHRRSSS